MISVQLSRFAKYYRKDGVESRTLIKAYGIRLDVIVHGHVRAFSVITTLHFQLTLVTVVIFCFILFFRPVNSVPFRPSLVQWLLWLLLGLWVITTFRSYLWDFEVADIAFSNTNCCFLHLSTLQCTIICDWIMLTFIDKNEVYSDRKFDEVSTWHRVFNSNTNGPFYFLCFIP